jgi:hypothetical protein
LSAFGGLAGFFVYEASSAKNANGANISVNKSISHTALLSSITANFFIIIF